MTPIDALEARLKRAKWLAWERRVDLRAAVNEREYLRGQRDALQDQVAHWKANHDNQVAIRAAVMDRPDLGDRAKRVADLIAERDAAVARAEQAEQALLLIGERAVVDWDDATVGAVDAVVPEERRKTYAEWLRETLDARPSCTAAERDAAVARAVAAESALAQIGEQIRAAYAQEVEEDRGSPLADLLRFIFAERIPELRKAKRSAESALAKARGALKRSSALMATAMGDLLPLKPVGHDGDAESGEHYPDCERCTFDAAMGMLEGAADIARAALTGAAAAGDRAEEREFSRQVDARLAKRPLERGENLMPQPPAQGEGLLDAEMRELQKDPEFQAELAKLRESARPPEAKKEPER